MLSTPCCRLTVPRRDRSTRLRSSTADGYVYAVDAQGGLWRVDLTTGTVYPNLGTAYTGLSPAYPTNAARELTDSSGTNSFFSAKGYFRIGNMILLNNSLWLTEDGLLVHDISCKLPSIETPSRIGQPFGVGPPSCIGDLCRFIECRAMPERRLH